MSINMQIEYKSISEKTFQGLDRPYKVQEYFNHKCKGYYWKIYSLKCWTMEHIDRLRWGSINFRIVYHSVKIFLLQEMTLSYIGHTYKAFSRNIIYSLVSPALKW